MQPRLYRYLDPGLRRAYASTLAVACANTFAVPTPCPCIHLSLSRALATTIAPVEASAAPMPLAITVAITGAFAAPPPALRPEPKPRRCHRFSPQPRQYHCPGFCRALTVAITGAIAPAPAFATPVPLTTPPPMPSLRLCPYLRRAQTETFAYAVPSISSNVFSSYRPNSSSPR